MQVQNIECQIAQAQIARLLANEPLSKEIAADLESHVASCAVCQDFVMSRRQTLESVVGNAKPSRKQKRAVAAVVTSEPAEAQEIEELKRFAQKTIFSPKMPKKVDTTHESPTLSTFWKPLAYSGALALVLFGMSYVMKNPTALFGERADQAIQNKPTNSAGPSPTPPKTDQPTPSSDETANIATNEISILNANSTQTVEPHEHPSAPVATSYIVGNGVLAPKPTTNNSPVTPNQPAKPKNIVTAKPSVTIKAKTIKPRALTGRIGHKRRLRPRISHRNAIQFYDSNGRPLAN